MDSVDTRDLDFVLPGQYVELTAHIGALMRTLEAMEHGEAMKP